MSIYTNLFRYRPRPERNPLEDFLTAALADLLNRAPREISARFVAEVLLQQPDKRDCWLNFINSTPDVPLLWTTQVRIQESQTGVVDLLLHLGTKPAMIVESKVNALIRLHERGRTENVDSQAPRPATLPTDSQLRTYGRWLSARCEGETWPGALVLLTHFTAAPSDFGGPTSGDYGVPITCVCRWGTIWRWARKIGAPAAGDDGGETRQSWAELCWELAEFLEGENMASDYMTFHDLAALEIFVGSADRIEGTFDEIRRALGPSFEGLGKAQFAGPEYDSDHGVVWSWRYIRGEDGRPKDWYFAWGVRFPSVAKWWLNCEPPLPELPHAFLVLTSDGSEFPAVPTDLLQSAGNWQVTPEEGDIILAKPAHEFPASPAEFTESFAEWVVTSMNSMRPVLDAMISELR